MLLETLKTWNYKIRLRKPYKVLAVPIENSLIFLKTCDIKFLKKKLFQNLWVGVLFRIGQTLLPEKWPLEAQELTLRCWVRAVLLGTSAQAVAPDSRVLRNRASAMHWSLFGILYWPSAFSCPTSRERDLGTLHKSSEARPRSTHTPWARASVTAPPTPSLQRDCEM